MLEIVFTSGLVEILEFFPMTLSTILFLILGLALLIGGAEFLVRGASRLATAVGISPLVVGLT
ncbi:MAG: hypothetical protein KDN04_22465, partial [Verrucomicrobiae bacterium]|nr:hypothetical protein [Verrucomicrobiae bacterium]